MTGQTPSRWHGLDALRAAAMLMGIVLHAQMVLLTPSVHVSTLETLRPNSVADPLHGELWVIMTQVWIHLWRMPLFFVLSGFFVSLLIERRGVGPTLKDRSVRLLGPLAVFSVLFTLTIGLPWGQMNHMWFLWFLWLFGLCAAGLQIAGLKLPALTPSRLPLFVLGAAGLAAFGRDDFIWHAIPTHILDVEPIGFVYYLAFFVIGMSLWRGKDTTLGALAEPKVATLWLVFATLGYLGIVFRGNFPAALLPVCSGLATVGYTFGFIGLFQHLVTKSSPILTWFVRGAYPIYILHLYPVLALTTLMAEADFPQHWIVVLGTFGGFGSAVALWYLLVRYTPLDWLMSGYDKSWLKWPGRVKHA